MIRLCAFADEADSALGGQIAALRRNGIEYIELRGINGKNVSEITENEARDYAKELAAGGISVWSIGSPIGKVGINDDLEAHFDKLRHICRLAKIFGTDKIRMFSFYGAYGERERVFAALRRMVEIAKGYGVGLYHENEKDIYGDTAERVRDIMANVEGLYYVYDPANYIAVGEDVSESIKLYGSTDYFHIKDMIRETGEIVPAGYGDGEIYQLVDMIPTGKDTVLTVEPHLSLFSGFSAIDNTEMKNRFVYKDNNESFDAAVAAITEVLCKAGYSRTGNGFSKK